MPESNATKSLEVVLPQAASWKPSDRAVLTLKEVGRVLSIGQTKVFDLINKGHLRAIHIGRRTLIPVEAVDEFLRTGG